MRVLTVVGARPQFIKAAAVSQTLARADGIEELVVHTGQHYDRQLSDVFFSELGIPAPAHMLRIGSGSHGQQTGAMLQRLEEVMLAERPDCVLVYGDTNSTVAGALAASKLHIPIAHVESGMRSFDRRMPEEVNRVVTDHLGTLHLCATTQAVANLKAEGVVDGVHLVGDVMYDCALQFGAAAEKCISPLDSLAVGPDGYALVTCHRAENTDDPAKLAEIVRGVNRIAERLPVVFPVHPRTAGALAKAGLDRELKVQVIAPVSYLEMLVLEKRARLIVTDSGGVQKEAFFFRVPCVTMRDSTEWIETVEVGANILVGSSAERIAQVAHQLLDDPPDLPDPGSFYGEGQASARIAARLLGLHVAASGNSAVRLVA